MYSQLKALLDMLFPFLSFLFFVDGDAETTAVPGEAAEFCAADAGLSLLSCAFTAGEAAAGDAGDAAAVPVADDPAVEASWPSPIGFTPVRSEIKTGRNYSKYQYNYA